MNPSPVLVGVYEIVLQALVATQDAIANTGCAILAKEQVCECPVLGYDEVMRLRSRASELTPLISRQLQDFSYRAGGILHSTHCGEWPRP